MKEYEWFMKMFGAFKKLIYLCSCFLLACFLFGCKERDGLVSVFSGLPENTFVSEMKNALESKKPIVIAFTAEWCPHCRDYKPVFFDVKKDYEDTVSFINVDVDSKEGSVLSGRFQVNGIPTTAFVRLDGSVLKVQVGEIEKEKLKTIVDDLLKSKKKKRGEPIAPFPIEPVEVKAVEKKDVQVEEEPVQEVTEPPQEELQEEPSQEQQEAPKILEENTSDDTTPEIQEPAP